MKSPKTVSMFNTMHIADKDELDYCHFLNDIIRRLAVNMGIASVSPKFSGTNYVFKGNGLRCTYNDSDYGNDRYHLEISSDVWNDVPDDINYETVFDEGYNLVYSFQDSPDRQVLLQHIPGTWISFILNTEL